MSPYRTASRPVCAHAWYGRMEEYEWADSEFRYHDVRHVAECRNCGAPASWLRGWFMAILVIIGARFR